MPSSVLRRHGDFLRPARLPFLRYPWLSLPQEVDWTAAAGVSLTAGASNVKSAYVTLFAALASDCDALLIGIQGTGQTGANSSTLMDIATGVALSEVDVIPNFCTGYSSIGLGGSKRYLFPIKIASGTRVAMRAQSANAAPVAALVHAIALRLPHSRSPSALVNYGANLATSQGVAVTAAATWTQITAATTEANQGLVLTFGGNTDTTFSAAYDSISLGTGAAAAEVEIMRAIFRATTVEDHSILASGHQMFAPGHVAKGQRIAVQGNNATTNQLDAVVLGVPYS